MARFFADAPKRIRNALDALGYFGASFAHELTFTPTCWRYVVNLNLGERARVQEWSLEVIGALTDDPASKQIRSMIPPPDTVFDPQAYEQRKRDLLSRAGDLGFLDAKFLDHTVTIDSAGKTADVSWQIDSGPRYRVGNLLINQNVLKDDLFARYLSLNEGEPFRRADVLKTYADLNGSEYFRSVNIEPQRDQRAGGAVDVAITAEPTTQWTLLGGAGFATDTGPRLRGRANANYINDRGHRTGFESLLSPVLGHLKGEYRWPYDDPTHQWYAVESSVSYDDTQSAQSASFNLGLKRTQRLGKHWTQTLTANYLVEDFDVSVDEGRAQLLLFGTNLTYTSGIDAARPMRGRSASIDFKAASATLLSDNDVAQIRLNLKQIIAMPWQSRLLIRGQFGYSWQESFANLPPTLRFFAGGDNSVRGYGLEELGPLDGNGQVVGGSQLATGSVEFDFPIKPQWSAAIFADAGSAWNDEPQFNHSVGVGVRWYSPLGPVRVDLAHPLDDDGRILRLHISIGPDL